MTMMKTGIILKRPHYIAKNPKVNLGEVLGIIYLYLLKRYRNVFIVGGSAGMMEGVRNWELRLEEPPRNM